MIMLLKFQTKQKEIVNLSLENLKEITHKDSNYVRIFFKDGTCTSLTYNARSFAFHTDYELTTKELNSVIHQINLMN